MLALTLAQSAPAPTAPAAREIAPDTYLIPGAMLPNRGPDGNTVVLATPSGLIVIDTDVDFLRKSSGASPDCQAK